MTAVRKSQHFQRNSPKNSQTTFYFAQKTRTIRNQSHEPARNRNYSTFNMPATVKSQTSPQFYIHAQTRDASGSTSSEIAEGGGGGRHFHFAPERTDARSHPPKSRAFRRAPATLVADARLFSRDGRARHVAVRIPRRKTAPAKVRAAKSRCCFSKLCWIVKM